MPDENLNVVLARVEERIVASDKALTLATQELHRRLESLNGEAGRIRDILATCVPREVYERGIESVEKASKVTADEFDRRIKVLENQSANLAGRTWIAGAVVLILAAIIAAVIPLMRR
jgi:phage-related minor tail protein